MTVISFDTPYGSSFSTWGDWVFAPANGAWPVANMAWAMPFWLAASYTSAVAWCYVVAAGPGTIDIGVYDSSFTLVASLGATAPGGVGVRTYPFVHTFTSGQYWLAISSTSAAFATRQWQRGDDIETLLGALRQLGASPLPATFVPARIVLPNFIPQYGLSDIAAPF